MIIDLSSVLSELGSNQESTYSVSFNEKLMEDSQVIGEAETSVSLLNTGEGVLMTGQVSVAVDQTCAICMNNFQKELSISFEETIVQEFEEEELMLKEKEISSDDFYLTYNSEKEFDLAEFLREIIILNLPIAAKCDINCKVKNNTETKTIDPRLKVLEKFKTED